MTSERKFNGKKRDTGFRRKTCEVRSYDLYMGGHTYGRQPIQYTVQSLLDLITELPFDKVSIPVYASKKNVFGIDRKGNIQVGFVQSFDVDTHSFKVVLFGNTAQSVLKIENAEIFARVSVGEDETVKTIIGLDIISGNMFTVAAEEDEEEVLRGEA